MGQILSWFWAPPKGDFLVHVTTGDKLGAGTDANVWINLTDVNGRKVGPFLLDGVFRNDFERKQRDTFPVAPGEAAADTTDSVDADKAPLGSIAEIELWRDTSGFGDSWFLDLVEVERTRVPKRHHWFPVQRWIKPDVRYVFREFDSVLPQFDNRPGPREAELVEKRVLYQYRVNVPGGPAQIAKLPSDEMFSESYYLNFALLKATLEIKKLYLDITRSEWQSLDDLKSVFQEKSDLPPPPQVLDEWHKDGWFGSQRLIGVNPTVIRLCTKIPDKLGVDEEMLKPFMEGKSLAETLEQKRLFIVDHHLLEGNPSKTGQICAPIALFFRNERERLMPVAIQLYQQKGQDNPVFLPSDPKYTWILAKMYFNNADAQFHQSLTHLGFTHLIMEGVDICTHRHLSQSHPLFRLLAPHFLYLMAINTRGLEKLINPGGWVDRGMNVGYTGMMELIRKGLAQWRLDVQGCVPNDIKERQVDKYVLPLYPYRDDALDLYQIIWSYVSRIVRHFYDTPDKLTGDTELSSWRKELIKSKEEGGVGLLGVPGDPEHGFQNVDQLTDCLASIISTCSLAHAASNFGQYNAYGYLPNYPGMLLGSPPTTKDALTEKDIMTRIPDKRVILDIMEITNLLSMRGTNSLGDFEVQYAYDPVSVDSVCRMQQDLSRLSKSIRERNPTLEHPYQWLDPAQVPNAISV